MTYLPRDHNGYVSARETLTAPYYPPRSLRHISHHTTYDDLAQAMRSNSERVRRFIRSARRLERQLNRLARALNPPTGVVEGVRHPNLIHQGRKPTARKARP